ncbi:cellulose binding domain-containing protein, partial [Cellvibrio mixtus]|uniref:cellulose binding domain-containing protein n=1 Tax=Cellvibrio mixtus TaxID=39650 RepID=UPI00190F697F
MMNKQKNSARLLPQVLRNTCGVIGLGATLLALSNTAFAACTYSVDNEWGSGYVASITVKNDTNA